MSVKTVAQSFEHKPFVGNKNENNNNNAAKQPRFFYSQENLRERARSLKSRNNTQTGRLPTTSSPNELSTFKFKNSLKNSSHSPRRTPTATANSTVGDAIARRAPPADEELKVKAVADEKTSQQLKNEEELRKLPSGSIMNRKLLLFEKAGKNVDVSSAAPLRRHSTKSGGVGCVGFTSTSTVVNEKEIKKIPLLEPSNLIRLSKDDVVNRQESATSFQEKPKIEFNQGKDLITPAEQKIIESRDSRDSTTTTTTTTVNNKKMEFDKRRNDNFNEQRASTITSVQKKTESGTNGEKRNKTKQESIYEVNSETY